MEKNLTTDTTIHALSVLGVQDGDFGEYLCRATNEFGTTSQSFQLRKARSIPTPSSS